MSSFRIIKPAVDMTEYQLQLLQGGHGAGNKEQALVNLGAVSKGSIDVNSGILGLDSAGLGATGKFPTPLAQYKPTITGDKFPAPGFPCLLKITNYDMFNTYTLAASEGAISRSGDTISYTPGTAGAKTLTINGSPWTATAVANAPNAPVATASYAGFNDTKASVYFVGSAFAMRYGTGTHLNTDWQVATDQAFASITVQSMADATNKVSWQTTSIPLNFTGWMRYRHRSAAGEVGEWSTPLAVVTAASYPLDKEEAKFAAVARAALDRFGYRIAISGDGTRLAVGAIGANSSKGQVTIFLRTGTTWGGEVTLSPAGTAGGADNFGMCVSLDQTGTRLAAGAQNATSGGVGVAGISYIFSRSGTTWSQEAVLNPTDPVVTGQFGYSICICGDGTRVLVGAAQASHLGVVQLGAGYVFTRSGTVWTFHSKLVMPDFETGSVAIMGADNARLSYNGYVAVLGARLKTVAGVTNAGAGYVFMFNGSVYEHSSILIPHQVAQDMLGSAMAVSGDGLRIAISGKYTNNVANATTGAIYIYVYDAASVKWVIEQTLFRNETAANSGPLVDDVYFNYDGSRLIAGSRAGNPDGKSMAGMAWIFSRTGSVWKQESRLSASDGLANDYFGCGVSMTYNGDRVAVGAYYADISGVADCGAAYVFT